MTTPPLPTVDELMEKAFQLGREPRSAEYKRGVRDMLARRLDGARPPIPYDQASAQRDAYYSGWDEGREIWLKLKNTPGMAEALLRPEMNKDEIVSVAIASDGRTTPKVTATTRAGRVIEGAQGSEG